MNEIKLSCRVDSKQQQRSEKKREYRKIVFIISVVVIGHWAYILFARIVWTNSKLLIFRWTRDLSNSWKCRIECDEFSRLKHRGSEKNVFMRRETYAIFLLKVQIHACKFFCYRLKLWGWARHVPWKICKNDLPSLTIDVHCEHNTKTISYHTYLNFTVSSFASYLVFCLLLLLKTRVESAWVNESSSTLNVWQIFFLVFSALRVRLLATHSRAHSHVYSHASAIMFSTWIRCKQ